MSTELVTRYVRADMTAHNGFAWPKSGPVSCPDWNPAPKCGNGLHGWLHGKGDASAWEDRCVDDLMLVVEVEAAVIVSLGGKVKFPTGVVVYCGDAAGMSSFMAERGHADGVIHRVDTGGDASTLTGGYASTLTGGYASTLTGGARSTLTGGEKATILIRWWQRSANRWRTTIGYIGEDGLKPNTPYKCDENGKLCEVTL